MKSRDRILAALKGGDMDRIPMMEIGFWPETIARWKKEGLPSAISPHEYFNLDTVSFFSFNGSLRFAPQVIEEDERFQVYTDGNGNLNRILKDGYKIPELIDSRVKTIDDWDNLRTRLDVDFQRFTEVKTDIIHGLPLTASQTAIYDESVKNETFRVISPIEPCWFFLRLMNEEEALVNIAAEPDFVERIISDCNEFNIKMMQMLHGRGFKFNAVWVFSDLAYKNGILFSPAFYRERVMPYTKKFFAFCKELGMKVIYHSDGNLKDLLPLLIEAGIDCMQPLEARAGNNVIDFIKKFDKKISYMGNINADVLTSGKENIYEEVFTKVTFAKPTNRYIFHSDHSIPPTISLDNYSYALSLARDLGKYT